MFDGASPDNSKTPPLPASHLNGAARLQFRAIWISDIHLGTVGCQAGHLLEFLKHTDSRHLYLVGDIIDGWALKRRWYWHQQHNDIVQKILRKAKKGTRVTFIAGNHDEAARQFLGLGFGGITIADEAIHTTALGKRLLVIHGDQFDGVVQCAKWLAYVGDYLYDLTLKLNRGFIWIRRKIGLPYWSLSQYLKHKVKNAVSYISAFEEAVAREARTRGVDGVVCGHIPDSACETASGFRTRIRWCRSRILPKFTRWRVCLIRLIQITIIRSSRKAIST